eukprot:1160227-Pelagomonas_calceolata.AAC.5
MCLLGRAHTCTPPSAHAHAFMPEVEICMDQLMALRICLYIADCIGIRPDLLRLYQPRCVLVVSAHRCIAFVSLGGACPKHRWAFRSMLDPAGMKGRNVFQKHA